MLDAPELFGLIVATSNAGSASAAISFGGAAARRNLPGCLFGRAHEREGKRRGALCPGPHHGLAVRTQLAFVASADEVDRELNVRTVQRDGGRLERLRRLVDAVHLGRQLAVVLRNLQDDSQFLAGLQRSLPVPGYPFGGAVSRGLGAGFGCIDQTKRYR